MGEWKPLETVTEERHSAHPRAEATGLTRRNDGFRKPIQKLLESAFVKYLPKLHSVQRTVSAFAAKTKSLSVRPSILWVQSVSFTSPQAR
ncbi:hypothetical protein Cflav_PD2231 [Pedosphaera parvula Ellin514]|uniref:Uncharacterized protein n=1 Tax=Pedosphaera parvula (strain Ellin514) TaxID=320771 RepID=B9XL36_PEDPL|nr:hypothetical protein Cflav_PD2231 [Pedosphaera parvula Ellin514]